MTSNDCFSPAQKLMSTAQAIEILRRAVETLVTPEECALSSAAGRVLAQDLISSRDIPGFNNAAVDGYAFTYSDYQAQQANLFPVSASIAAGDADPAPIAPGTAVRILTGARMPEGADTVVMQEDVKLRGDQIALPGGVKRGGNCRLRGEDVVAGARLLPQGHRLRPQDVGMAAAIGLAKIAVYRPLKVALFSTGNEILEPGSSLGGAGVYDVNRYMLKALLQPLGVTVTDLGILKDDRESVSTALLAAAQDHQVILTSGGISTGAKDYVAQILAQKGNIHFWRMAIKPGRPLAFGMLNNTRFIGFPGNPVAVAVCFLRFAHPFLAALGGQVWPEPEYYPVASAFAMTKKSNRREWVRAKLIKDEQGQISVDKHLRQGSGVLSSLVEGDGLVELPEQLTQVDKGDLLSFLPFSQYFT